MTESTSSKDQIQTVAAEPELDDTNTSPHRLLYRNVLIWTAMTAATAVIAEVSLGLVSSASGYGLELFNKFSVNKQLEAQILTAKRENARLSEELQDIKSRPKGDEGSETAYVPLHL